MVKVNAKIDCPGIGAVSARRDVLVMADMLSALPKACAVFVGVELAQVSRAGMSYRNAGLLLPKTSRRCPVAYSSDGLAGTLTLLAGLYVLGVAIIDARVGHDTAAKRLLLSTAKQADSKAHARPVMAFFPFCLVNIYIY